MSEGYVSLQVTALVCTDCFESKVQKMWGQSPKDVGCRCETDKKSHFVSVVFYALITTFLSVTLSEVVLIHLGYLSAAGLGVPQMKTRMYPVLSSRSFQMLFLSPFFFSLTLSFTYRQPL